MKPALNLTLTSNLFLNYEFHGVFTHYPAPSTKHPDAILHQIPFPFKIMAKVDKVIFRSNKSDLFSR